MSDDTVVDEDVFVGEAGHAVKHTELGLQVNYLTGRMKAVREVINPGGRLSPAQLSASIDGAVSKVGAAFSTPLYIETAHHAMVIQPSSNARSGLPSTTFPGGGATTEMTLTVSGAAGGNTLTTSDTAKVAGFGPNPFDIALLSPDEQDGFYATVIPGSSGGTITLLRPLPVDVTGWTLANRMDEAFGQHMTQVATKVLALLVAGTAPTVSARGGVLTRFDQLRAAPLDDLDYNDVWVRNAALVSYGQQLSPEPYVFTSLDAQGVQNQALQDKIVTRPNRSPSGISVGTHLVGHGVDGTFYTQGREVVLDFWTGAQRDISTSTKDDRIRVVVTVDGTVMLDEERDCYATRTTMTVLAGSKIGVSVTNARDRPLYVQVSGTTLREAGHAPRPGFGRKIVCLGDSWFIYYDSAFGKALAKITGRTVITHALGGMTSQWALANFDDFVLAERPDEVILNFYTNDLNNNQGTAVWPNGLSDTQARALHRANMIELVRRCLAAGIRPIVILPGLANYIAQMDAGLTFERPHLVDFVASGTAELADPTTYVNTIGKRPGARVVAAGAQKIASGGAPADAWT